MSLAANGSNPATSLSNLQRWRILFYTGRAWCVLPFRRIHFAENTLVPSTLVQGLCFFVLCFGHFLYILHIIRCIQNFVDAFDDPVGSSRPATLAVYVVFQFFDVLNVICIIYKSWTNRKFVNRLLIQFNEIDKLIGYSNSSSWVLVKTSAFLIYTCTKFVVYNLFVKTGGELLRHFGARLASMFIMTEERIMITFCDELKERLFAISDRIKRRKYSADGDVSKLGDGVEISLNILNSLRTRQRHFILFNLMQLLLTVLMTTLCCALFCTRDADFPLFVISTSSCLMWAVSCFESGTRFVLLVIALHGVKVGVMELAETVGRAKSWPFMDCKDQSEFVALHDLVRASNYTFSAWGFFEINNSLIFSVASGIISYVFVIAQLK